MGAKGQKRKITINRKKKEVNNEVEEKVVSLEEALEEITGEENTVSTVVENEINNEKTIGFTRPQLKGEIVGNGTRTVIQQPRGRIKFEAQHSAVPMFKLPEEIRRYLTSNGLPTTVWQWDKEKLEKRKVDMNMVEKLKEFLSNM